ncbi:Leucine-, isoleucine-, valine-, threonine-, and alanine-binding protein [Fundidesulfovibrio magnetotacticus]|uniref:Leucine-, isoleucine-, valine-, threonine-, and alanine-binding protein n=1 Tax=Fundidesulfovibrio magnetotacticus TaxID=2730080 RepID=A0A6V8LX27_9BACT|nr:ABC transporter substrate-binding protein [Fundidesulfovibrio magnetotacticus]GFK92835.1 Leucine-, isoleucine-, valine-, threonine-, and alanine-binding protein [Fundidesulfovibrio magnetotacticus]
MTIRFVAILLALALAPGPVAAQAPGPLRLGVSIPLTGAAAGIGQYLLWGVEIAAQEANSAGGVNGRPVELVIEDDETDPDKARANARHLVEQERVAAVLGPANSGNALAMIPVLQQAKTPLMLLTASATPLTRPPADGSKNYVFRATLPDRDQLRKLVDWAAPRFQSIAVAADTTPYGNLCLQDITELMAEKGIKPVAVVRFDLGEQDLTPKARELARSTAQAVALLTLGQEVANFVRGADQAGYSTRFIGQYPFFLQPVKDLPERLSNGLTGVLGSSADASPKAREIDRLVRTRYRVEGYYPFKFVEAAYEGTRLVLEAAARAAPDDGTALRDALESTERFEGVSRVFLRPFSPGQHELYKADNLSMGVWKDGAVVRLDE